MHLSKFTQLMELGQNQATSELPTSCCLSQGDSCVGRWRSKGPGELGKALLPRGPYSVWMSQFIPTGYRLDIRDSGLFIPIL